MNVLNCPAPYQIRRENRVTLTRRGINTNFRIPFRKISPSPSIKYPAPVIGFDFMGTMLAQTYV